MIFEWKSILKSYLFFEQSCSWPRPLIFKVQEVCSSICHYLRRIGVHRRETKNNKLIIFCSVVLTVFIGGMVIIQKMLVIWNFIEGMIDKTLNANYLYLGTSKTIWEPECVLFVLFMINCKISQGVNYPLPGNILRGMNNKKIPFHKKKKKRG